MRLDDAWDADAHAAELLRVVAMGDVADIHAEQPGIVSIDIVVESTELHIITP